MGEQGASFIHLYGVQGASELQGRGELQRLEKAAGDLSQIHLSGTFSCSG